MTINPTELAEILKKKIEKLDFEDNLQDVGYVFAVGDGIAQIYGLKKARMSEVVKFESGEQGIVLNLAKDSISVSVLGNVNTLTEGEKVTLSGHILEVPVGSALLGRIVDSMGKPLDDLGPIDTSERQLVNAKAPGVIDRSPVNQPMETGIKAIDLMIPIGRGQRELIIGDRQIGKTSIVLDTIINQKKNNAGKDPNKKLYCIYVAIGQKDSKIANIARILREHGAMEYTTIVNASASMSATLQYLAPYAGCAMGEYYRDNGLDALIIYDDLSKHAVAYRQISLLLGRPPGREAYPGDVFYLHSRLLERAAKLNKKLKGGSLTALPIVETQAGDISDYISTNIISITDGQIYLSGNMFYQGFRPAIDVGLSVSRVGSAAQPPLIRKIAGNLKSTLAQYNELRDFAKFESDLDATTKDILKRGNQLRILFKQSGVKPVSMPQDFCLFYAYNQGLFDNVPNDKLFVLMDQLLTYLNKEEQPLLNEIETVDKLTDAIGKRTLSVVETFIKNYGN